jgi:hypothetical protein
LGYFDQIDGSWIDGSLSIFGHRNANTSVADQIFCLPVPEKAKPQYNFVVIPKEDPAASSPVDTIVWTAPEANLKNPQAIPGPEAMTAKLDEQLIKYGNKVVWPNEDEFVSEAGGNKVGGRVFGVRAHRGSKEGMNQVHPVRPFFPQAVFPYADVACRLSLLPVPGYSVGF